MPLAVGVPLMVNTLLAQVPVTPAGKPVTVAPVTLVVAYVILVIAVLVHLVCEFVPTAEVKAMVAFGLTISEPLTILVSKPQVPLTIT